MRDGLLKLLNLELQSHPFSVLRAAALTKWVDTGGYGAIMAGNYPRRVDDQQCPVAGRRRRRSAALQGRLRPVGRPVDRGIRDGLGGIVDGVGQAATSAADSVGRKISEWRRGPKSD